MKNKQIQESMPKNAESHLHGNDSKLGYISNFNNKRNPDLLIPGGALKGNLYFKQDELVEAGTITDPVDLSPLSSGSDSGIDDYKKLKS
jgi:hypothetical protein